MKLKPVYVLLLVGLMLGLIYHIRQNIIHHQADPLTEIISEHTRAMGGIKLWNNLKSYRIYHKKANGMEIILTANKPDQCRIEFQNDSLYIVKSFDGKSGCVLKNGEINEMRLGEQREMAEEPLFFEELMQYQSLGYELAYNGIVHINDEPCHKIELIKSDQDHQQYWLDARSYLIKMIAEYSDDPAHKGIYYKTTFDDFRLVDGYIFPFKIELKTDKKSVDLSCHKIEVNFPIEDDYFTCISE